MINSKSIFLGLVILNSGCRGYFPSPKEVDSFLDIVTNIWWNLQTEDINFYLERDGRSNGGIFWLDFIDGPELILEFNVEGGEWQYESDEKFHIFNEEEHYPLNVKEIDEPKDCWKVSFSIFYTDIACIYDGEFNSYY